MIGQLAITLAGRAGAAVLSGLGVAVSSSTVLRVLMALPIPWPPAHRVPRVTWCRRCAGGRLGSSRQEVALCHDDYGDNSALLQALPQGGVRARQAAAAGDPGGRHSSSEPVDLMAGRITSLADRLRLRPRHRR